MASAASPSPLPVVSLSASCRAAPTTTAPYHPLLQFSRRSGLSSGSASASRARLRVEASKADPVEERLPAAPDPVAEPQPEVRTSTWKWRGYNIRYQYAGTSGPALVLIHGFGANSDHWRKNIPVLAMANRVYAIDLIGYGYSDKPNPRELGESFYSFETWENSWIHFVPKWSRVKLSSYAIQLEGLLACRQHVMEPQKCKGIVLLDISLRMLHMKKQP